MSHTRIFPEAWSDQSCALFLCTTQLSSDLTWGAMFYSQIDSGLREEFTFPFSQPQKPKAMRIFASLKCSIWRTRPACPPIPLRLPRKKPSSPPGKHSVQVRYTYLTKLK